MRRIRKETLPVLMALATVASPPAYSQDSTPLVENNAASSEADKQQAIERVQEALAGRSPNEILSISGTQKVDDQVIFVDTLRFDDGAQMQLKAADRETIFIVANEVRLSGPNFKGTIEFYDREPKHGADGLPPAGALPRLSRGGGQGRDGQAGNRGNPGEQGKTRKLPTIYFVTSKIVQSTGGEPNFSDLRMRLDGIDGGNGGAGGKGQQGQGGQDGRHGRANDLGICTRGPGSGGRGGRGGAFGIGGKGGNGGDGGDVVFIVPPETVEAVKDIRVRNRGGLVGVGGKHGEPGAGGNGGSRGSRPGLCRGGSSGARGASGEKPPSPRADQGESEGRRGTVTYYVSRLLPR